MPRPLHFSAFVISPASHITHGLWRDPESDPVRFNRARTQMLRPP